MAEKKTSLKFPFSKTYPWIAEVRVELPELLGREERIFRVNGEKTFEFHAMKDPSRASFKVTSLKLTFPGATLMLGHKDYPLDFSKQRIKAPEFTLESNAVDPEDSRGFVHLETGRFSLQFKIYLKPNFPKGIDDFLRPMLKEYGMDEVPVIIHESGQIDLDEGDRYKSKLRFFVDPAYEGKFRFYCGGSKDPPKCEHTKTNLSASLTPEGPHVKTVYSCPGQTVYLKWHSSDDIVETSITPGVGAVQRTGATQVAPNVTTTYKIIAKGADTGETRCTAEDTINVHVVQDGDTIDMKAYVVSATNYWEFILPESEFSSGIVVTSIEPRCEWGCAFISAINLIYQTCYGGDVNCHAIWSLWKENPDGSILLYNIALLRIDMPETPALVGTWRFIPYGVDPPIRQSKDVGGTANFRLWVKCGR